MDTQSILDSYKDGVKDTPILLLSNGGTVVGEQADENNQLWYIIKNNGQYTFESAQNQSVISILKPLSSQSTTVKTIK